MVDTTDLKSVVSNGVPVRVRPAALFDFQWNGEPKSLLFSLEKESTHLIDKMKTAGTRVMTAVCINGLHCVGNFQATQLCALNAAFGLFCASILAERPRSIAGEGG